MTLTPVHVPPKHLYFASRKSDIDTVMSEGISCSQVLFDNWSEAYSKSCNLYPEEPVVIAVNAQRAFARNVHFENYADKTTWFASVPPKFCEVIPTEKPIVVSDEDYQFLLNYLGME